MKYPVLALLVTAAVLAVAAISNGANQHKGSEAQGRAQDQSYVGLQDRDRSRLQDPFSLKDEDIYGHKVMSPEELNQYRERLRLIKTEEERLRFEAQHREAMQRRARALQIKIEDAE